MIRKVYSQMIRLQETGRRQSKGLMNMRSAWSFDYSHLLQHKEMAMCHGFELDLQSPRK